MSYVIIRIRKGDSLKWLALLNLHFFLKKRDRVLSNTYSSNEFVTFACS